MNSFTSILLALIVFTSSVGVPISRHYCGGTMESFAIFSMARSCHVEKAVSCPSHSKKGSEIKRKNCCGDEFDYIQLDKDREIESSGKFLSAFFATSFLPLSLFQEFSAVARLRKLGKLERYRPPPLMVDVMRQWGVYLI